VGSRSRNAGSVSTVDLFWVCVELRRVAFDMYELIRVEVRGIIAYATIDIPPANVITRDL
jgi:hypothetical protein